MLLVHGVPFALGMRGSVNKTGKKQLMVVLPSPFPFYAYRTIEVHSQRHYSSKSPGFAAIKELHASVGN